MFEPNPPKSYIPANPGWYVHYLAWIPADGTVNFDGALKYFIITEPVLAWCSTDNSALNPVTADTGNPYHPTNGIKNSTQNFAYLGVFNHDSYRLGDAVSLPNEYNPMVFLDSPYTSQDGVLEEDLLSFFADVKEEALALKKQDSEETSRKHFAERMELEKAKAELDEKLRLSEVISSFRDSGDGLVL